jgi:hypothetical protein
LLGIYGIDLGHGRSARYSHLLNTSEFAGDYGVDLGHGRSARYSYLMETGQSSWVTAFLLAGLGHGLSARHSNLLRNRSATNLHNRA